MFVFTKHDKHLLSDSLYCNSRTILLHTVLKTVPVLKLVFKIII